MRIFLILIAGAVTVAAADFKPTAQDSIVAKGAKAELVWAGGKFTEGPTLGPKGVIFFSDIGMRTMRFDPASGKTIVFREPSGKANGLMMDRKANLIACEGAHGGGRGPAPPDRIERDPPELARNSQDWPLGACE